MSEQENKKYMPSLTLGVRIIIIMVCIGSGLVALLSGYSQTKADGERIFYEGEPYRLVTAVFAVGSIVELGFMLICFVWILFQVTEYQKKYSTVYTVYHFWIVNLNIYFNTVSLFKLLFILTKMKNFNMTVSGIYPYCLYMYLKTCINRPTESTNYWFMPFPMSRWKAGLAICLLSIWISTETQGCIIVFFYFIIKSFLLKVFSCLCKSKCNILRKEGPMFPCIFEKLEKCLYFWAKDRDDFISMSQTVQTESEEKSQLGQEIQMSGNN